MNLLNETLEELKSFGKSTSDIKWIGSRDGKYCLSWDDFSKISNFEYDNGFGTQEIADDLVVVGDSWWLERHEYDGSEGWVFKTTPVLQANCKGFHSVKGDSFLNSLESINGKNNQ